MDQFDVGDALERVRADAEYMHFLVAAGELLSSSLDYRQTLKGICISAVESIADICILDIGTPNDLEMVGAAHRLKRMLPQMARVASHLEQAPGRPPHPVRMVVNNGQTYYAPHIDDAWIEAHAANDAHADFMRAMGYRSMIVVPVRSQVWGISGALTLVRTSLSRKQYDEGAIPFAEDLGRRCGIAIGKARLYSQTLHIAERLQRAALPHALPDIPGFLLDAFYAPADAAMLIGGDWYDAFPLRDGKVGITVGDVAGHGIESAALMSSIRNALRMAMVIEPSLPDVLRHADFLFRAEAPGLFCTAVAAVLDPATATLQFASAGHPMPLLWLGERIYEPRATPALPLGCGDAEPHLAEAETAVLPPGAMAVFFTDGLLEATRDLEHGASLLRSAIANEEIRSGERPAEAICEATCPGSRNDDVAILAVRRPPLSGSPRLPRP